MVSGTSPAYAQGPVTLRGDRAARKMVPGTSPARTGAPATSRGVPTARKWSLAHSQRSSCGVKAAREMVPGTSPTRTGAPATSRGVPIARKWSLAHSQRPRAVSHWLAKWSLAPPLCAHWPQLPGVESQWLPKMSLAPPQQAQGGSDFARGPSGSPNGLWHLPSTCTGPSDPPWVPSGSQNEPWHLPSTHTGPRDLAQCSRGSPNGPWPLPSTHTGPRDPAQGASGSPNGPWLLPSSRICLSNPVQGPSGMPNGPWHLPITHMGPRVPARGPSGSQMVPDTSLTHPQRMHGPQRPRAGSQLLIKWKLMSTLKSKLKKQSTATGSGVATAFLRTQAALFGSYRDDLRYKPGEPISFCEDSFINHRSSTMRAFLKMAVNLQLFKQFIDGRLARINAGKGFSDVFEEEITEGGFCGANSRSYQQWMQPVKKGGAMINTAVTKASPAVKTAYKFETDEEDGQVSIGSPTSTKSLSPKRKQGQRQRKFHRPNTSMGCADFVLDDDEMDTASKLSSEDSGEVSACIEDSDDSCEMDSDKQYTGKMDLLGEILDTLSINSSDQGKLSGAKSLDFLRSMDDIDCKAVNKSNTPSEISLPQLCMGGSEHTGWNLGQDDSMLHGKHLPPSPRRQNCGGPGDALYVVTEEHSPIPHGLHKKDLSKITVNSAPPVGSQNALAQADRSSVVQRDKLPKQTLKCSPESTFQEQSPKKKGRQPSVLVPWEKEDIEEDLKTETEEKGLLEEIESIYCISSAFNAGLNISDPGEKA
ncbi:UNVERIFIED_CONTAM: hypothetical protein FKN15_065272 [Acipenser sinensis]